MNQLVIDTNVLSVKHILPNLTNNYIGTYSRYVYEILKIITIHSCI